MPIYTPQTGLGSPNTTLQRTGSRSPTQPITNGGGGGVGVDVPLPAGDWTGPPTGRIPGSPTAPTQPDPKPPGQYDWMQEWWDREQAQNNQRLGSVAPTPGTRDPTDRGGDTPVTQTRDPTDRGADIPVVDDPTTTRGGGRTVDGGRGTDRPVTGEPEPDAFDWGTVPWGDFPWQGILGGMGGGGWGGGWGGGGQGWGGGGGYGGYQPGWGGAYGMQGNNPWSPSGGGTAGESGQEYPWAQQAQQALLGSPQMWRWF